jgi:hypothetical protein
MSGAKISYQITPQWYWNWVEIFSRNKNLKENPTNYSSFIQIILKQ